MRVGEENGRSLSRLTWAFILPSLFSLILALAAPLAGAQDVSENFDPNPLRPADTSSPRDTLRSFLTNVNEAVRAYREGKYNVKTDQIYSRAVETLDLSTTPHSDSWQVQTRRLLYLKEILDRIELPPDHEIPGDREVADGTITRWTIPDTRIIIARIEADSRAGEFLFSADTVQRLDRFYRRARHLPYKPGATTAGFYEEYFDSPDTPEAVEQEIQYRLKPVDTSNPRSTLLGFLDSVSRAYTLVMEAEAALSAAPSTMTKEQALEIEARANHLLQRAIGTLDLSQLPQARRQDAGIETVLRLKEIFDRMQLPHLDRVPDTAMVEAALERARSSSSKIAAPFDWKYPNTKIAIREVLEGERKGEFLFSAETVRRSKDFYHAIRELPYRRSDLGVEIGEYENAKKSEGFYNHYISTPGYLVPQAHFLGNVLDDLPAWLNTIYDEQTVWQWIALLLCVLALLILGYVIFRTVALLVGQIASPLNYWVMILGPVIVAIIVSFVRDFIDEGLNITGTTLSNVGAVAEVAVLILIVWAIWKVLSAVTETLIASPRIEDQSIDASMLRIFARLIGIVAGVWIVLDGLQALGADIIPLLAGLGVGGLAVALAVRPTLENLIGGMNLYFDRPVRVGDFCTFGDQTGTVESIGIRSTQIRALDRTLVSVPNAKFADMEIINWAHCDRMMIDTVIGLRFETTPDQMRYVLAKIREMLHAHPRIDQETIRVRYAGPGASSRDISIRIYALTREWNDFHAIREDVFLRIDDIIDEAGTSYAFPSQTLYMGRDDGLDEDRNEKAVQEVQSWRRSGELPFPRFSASRLAHLEGTLDYPPRGSPDAVSAGEEASAHPEPLSIEPELTDDDEVKKQTEPERR